MLPDRQYIDRAPQETTPSHEAGRWPIIQNIGRTALRVYDWMIQVSVDPPRRIPPDR